jgi:hypothetical protein
MLSFILLRLTFRGVLSDIPHDTAAFITYALLLLFIAFVWSGRRDRA